LGTLQNLSNSLLKLTQIHSNNNGNKNWGKISLSEVINSACNKLTPLAKKKKINIAVKVPEIIIKGDKTSLAEVFLILLDNAIKYGRDNSQISISAEKVVTKVKVSIKDQGIGIPKSDLPHIFERFFRADKSRSLVEGYGLGLSIAKKIIEDHKGTISALSTVGKGSIFSVELPLNT
jgi:two-component system sensor histidine kinase CiaH